MMHQVCILLHSYKDSAKEMLAKQIKMGLKSLVNIKAVFGKSVMCVR
jgi:hypothetical protein